MRRWREVGREGNHQQPGETEQCNLGGKGRERGEECLVAEDGGGGHKTHLHWGFFLFYYEDKKHVSEQGRVPSIEFPW